MQFTKTFFADPFSKSTWRRQNFINFDFHPQSFDNIVYKGAYFWDKSVQDLLFKNENFLRTPIPSKFTYLRKGKSWHFVILCPEAMLSISDLLTCGLGQVSFAYHVFYGSSI